MMQWNEWLGDIKQILISLGGRLVSDWEKDAGKLVMRLCFAWVVSKHLLCTCDGTESYHIWPIHHMSHFATPFCLPSLLCLTFFLLFSVGAFRLAYSHYLLFLFIAILPKSTVITSHGSDLIVDFLWFSTYLPRFEQFGQILFSISKTSKFKPWISQD